MNKRRGFTLIELLVVVAILGILATIVLASLNGARRKAIISANKQSAQQIAILMHKEYADNGSYTNLLNSTFLQGSAPTCDTMAVTGTYETEYREICNSVRNRLGAFGAGPNENLFWLVGDADVGQKFSIMVRTSPFNSSPEWFCVGSSGRISINTGFNFASIFMTPGCYLSP